MKEIKFRAWDFKENKMYQDVQNTYDGMDGHKGHDSFGGLMYFVKKGELCIMQFTGLKDKNGKEIYEGDIVKYQIKNMVTDLSKNKTYYEKRYIFEEIKWKEEICLEFGGYISGFELPEEANILEVAGNIYENGDLLK